MSTLAIRTATVATALLLTGLVVHVNTSLYEPSGRPRLASPDSGADATDRDVLKRVLRANPGQVDALLLLARDHDRAGESDAARRAYATAFELAPTDREVLGLGAEFFLRHAQASEAIAMLDHLAASYPDSRPRVFPVLAALLGERRDPAAWHTVAARKPAWLGEFIVSACRAGTDPRLLVSFLLDRVAQGRAAGEETACVIDKLRDADRWPQAYHVWLNTLPRERLADVGFVFNGSFEYAPTGVGFDWVASRSRERDVGHTVEMPQAAGAAGKRALRVSYNGKRQAGMPVAQYLVLPAGRYEMSGMARQQSLTTGRGVQWTLRCVKEGKPQSAIASSERFLGSNDWRRFAFEISVPADCPGQILQLEPVGIAEGPVYVSGSAWFDDLVLRRRG